MKKTLLTIFYCLTGIFTLQAQSLYGATFLGGDNGGGSINKFIPGTNDLTVAKSLEGIAKNPFYTNFTRGSDGKLYGMTSGGGSKGYGVIFAYDPVTSAYTTVIDFDNNSGGNPYGSLMQASDGKLYGMTVNGGDGGYGVIFSYEPSSSAYSKLKDFNTTDGANPYGSLIQATDGKLYGMTSIGGSSGRGVIFSFDPVSFDYIKLIDFDASNGATPYGSLVQGKDEKLYGLTVGGGSNGVGVIFSFDPYSPSYNHYTKLWDFDNFSGANPFGSLVQATDGKLYGMTSAGGTTFTGGGTGAGVIFSFDPVSLSYLKRRDFDITNGAVPYGSLIQANDGSLYGITEGGGSGSAVIFSYDLTSSVYTKLHGFDNSNPFGSLVLDIDGKLYGMTSAGGSSGGGIIFSFDPVSLTYRKLRDIGSNETGSNISAAMIKGSYGKLYGMALNGGRNGLGAIFSFDPPTSTYTNLMDFEDTMGANPYGGVISAIGGRLYGMTTFGGSNGNGVIFSFDVSTLAYTKLVDFDNDNGANPYGSLTRAGNGTLYGMTNKGGSYGNGVIFSFDPASSIYKKLKDFDHADGVNPYGNLLLANDGKLYGITYGGGKGNAGVIFSYDPSSSIYSRLKDLGNSDGANSYGSVIQASDGKLYGITNGGGDNGYGVIFSFDPSSATYTKLVSFNNANGAYPYGSLTEASDHKLYGMTYHGGSSGNGVIFSFDPSSSVYKKLKDYTGADGANPFIGSAFIEVKPGSGENNPPIVNVTVPVDNAKYTGPALISLVANAKDLDGTIRKVEFYNGTTLMRTEYYSPYSWNWKDVLPGNYSLVAKAYDNNGNVASSAPVHVTVAVNSPPAVRLINPVNNQVIYEPLSIQLQAAAGDVDGSITKVELYNGETLLRTEYLQPYSWNWKDVSAGSYTITAKATDNNGGVTTSAPVHITVVPNKPPLVSISYPENNQVVPGPAIITLEANASDPDGSISTVAFFNGATLLRTEYFAPYSWNWKDVPSGSYTITAKATDNSGSETISPPVTIRVIPPVGSLFSSSRSISNDNAPGVKLTPDPVSSILNVYIRGFEQNKRITISVISIPGVTVKTMNTIQNQTVQMGVSSLSTGVYFLKAVSGDKVVYSRFVKL